MKWCAECGTRLEEEPKVKVVVGGKQMQVLVCENPRCRIEWTFAWNIHGKNYIILREDERP